MMSGEYYSELKRGNISRRQPHASASGATTIQNPTAAPSTFQRRLRFMKKQVLFDDAVMNRFDTLVSGSRRCALMGRVASEKNPDGVHADRH